MEHRTQIDGAPHPLNKQPTKSALNLPQCVDLAVEELTPPPNCDFVLTTYNALPNGFEESGDPKYHRWSTRLPIMASTLRQRKSDILMLNEVNRSMTESLMNSNAIGGCDATPGCHVVGKNGRSSGRSIQCAIAWNPQKFSCVQTEEMEGMRCVMALLRHTETSATTWLVAVHLAAGECDWSENRRLEQMTSIRAKLEQLSPADAHMIAGDMNSGPGLGHMYQQYLHKSLRGEHDWENLTGYDNPTYSGWARLAFDYVYAKGGLSRTTPGQRAPPPTARDVTVVDLPLPGPNRHGGSDHTAVTCHLRLPGLAFEDGWRTG
jgi:endonuclease/exonuclease/phosphatase family metal-dependent hydrolase